MLTPVDAADAGARRRRRADSRARRRRQPARPDAAAGQVPAAARRVRHSRARGRRRGRGGRARPSTRWRVGDRVCALVAGGGYAEYCAAPAPQCLPIPAGLSVEEAGGDARDVLHRLDERVRARPAAARRDASSSTAARAASARRRSSWRSAFGARVFATAGSRREVRGLRAARRRARDQLPDARTSSRWCKELTGGARRRRHPRHGRRRLRRAEPRGAGDRRPARPDRVPAAARRPRST